MTTKGFPRTYTVHAISAVLFLSCCLATPAESAPFHQGKVVAGYFEEWSIYQGYNVADIQNSGAADVLTHVLYAFAEVTPAGQCSVVDSWADYQNPLLPSVNGHPYTGRLFGNFAALLQLKQLHPNLKVLISIGGASETTTAYFSTAAATEAGRAKLASSCIDIFITGNLESGVSAAGLFDGVDLDWEFPTASDTQNFTALLAEFRRQLSALGKQNNKAYLLTIAAPAGAQNYSNLQLAAVATQLDFLNLETYDYHGTWESTTNHAAPLLGSPRDPARANGLYIDRTVSAYLQAGVPARKLVVGIPAYGRGWTGVPNVNHGLYQTSAGPAPDPPGDALGGEGIATYRALAGLSSAGFTVHHDVLSLADWLYNPATATFWTFDDQASVTAKMGYVQLRAGGLGGAFEWAIKDDDPNATLLKTMAKGLSLHF